MAGSPSGERFAVALVATATALVWLASHGMYRTGPGNVRVRATAHLYEAGVCGAVVANMADSRLGVRLGPAGLVAGALATGVLLQVGRFVFHSAVLRANRNGRHLRPTVVVGPRPEIEFLAKRLHGAPELGFSVVATVDDPDPTTLAEVTRSVGGNTVMVVPGAVADACLARLVRCTTNAGLNVHLVGGMSGIDPRRMEPVALGRDASLHVSCVSLDGWQSTIKRTFDLLLTFGLLIVTAPLFMLSALAVKLGDRGPVLFRQERVGRDGHSFTMLKFRSMEVDAESRLSEVAAGNQRSGPLFKVARDPRVTRVGRWLRAMSLDELPQLINVLKGDMSLVGPRPALASEVEQFSVELQRRHAVLPGITGLWQIEGRDDPDFAVYEETDLYYVENWSVALDTVILARTFRALASRSLRLARRSVTNTIVLD
ncbi:MAG: sugar transferase [Acidimicrobiia bacterium]